MGYSGNDSIVYIVGRLYGRSGDDPNAPCRDSVKAKLGSRVASMTVMRLIQVLDYFINLKGNDSICFFLKKMT